MEVVNINQTSLIFEAATKPEMNWQLGLVKSGRATKFSMYNKMKLAFLKVICTAFHYAANILN